MQFVTDEGVEEVQNAKENHDCGARGHERRRQDSHTAEPASRNFRTTGLIRSGRVSGAICPPSGIVWNAQCGQILAKRATISRIGRRVAASLTTSVRALRLFQPSIVVCSSMTASHS